jgi:hypothetical protein
MLIKRVATLATILVLGLIAQPISAAEPTESQSFSNISATTAAFPLKGGKYMACVIATFGGGSVNCARSGRTAQHIYLFPQVRISVRAAALQSTWLQANTKLLLRPRPPCMRL